MRHGRRARERQLESRLEQEAAEDHKVVAVAVLRLHDLHGLDLGRGHPEGGGGLARRGVRIVVVELLEPEGVDEVALLVVGRLLAEGELGAGFLEVVVLLADGEDAFFFWAGGPKGADRDGFFGLGVERYLRNLVFVSGEIRRWERR